ncbi:hypothetical protein ACHAXN_000523 [Cyclotella atomus]
MFYSRYLTPKQDSNKRSQPAGHPNGKNRPPPSPRNGSQARRRSGNASNLATGRWGGLGKSVKKGSFDPLKYSSKSGKKTVHFSTIEVQHFHFDWSCVDDCFYSRKELTAMGSARFDDAAALRRDRQLDCGGTAGSPATASHDDLDLSAKIKPRSISALLELALNDKDQTPGVSIRGIEHFVYPELQQEMIRKKKEVQAQVMLYVKSKRPDPQGWRLANHSRMYSQWARDVAMEKGRAYRVHDVDSGGAVSPSNSPSSLRTITSSASFSAASYYESENNTNLAVSPTNITNASSNLERRASDAGNSSVRSDEGLLKNNGGDGHNSLVGTTVHQFQELRIDTDVGKDELRMATSDEYDKTASSSSNNHRYKSSQSAGADTDEA